MRPMHLLGSLLVVFFVSLATAEEEPNAQLRDAIERGLAVVTRGAKNYPEHRQCFSCHHQTLPLMALATARDASLTIDGDVFAGQVAFTKKFFEGRKDSLAKGGRIGGAAATVSYGLWTFEIAEVKPDEVSDALVANLLKMQEADGRWRPPSVRPPLEESHVSCTVLSAYTLQQFARDDRMKDAEAALEKASQWLANAPLTSTEDFAFALLWHTRYRPQEERAAAVAKELWARQRADGGWGQTAEMESDAYATAQALYALDSERSRINSAEYRQGIELLLSTQQCDGSWHVKTRSKPVQKYFDNGDPHGVDQFISMAATSWATTVLTTYSQSLKKMK